MKLSIITINLNNCEGLKKTIGSVINQTFSDFEYIVIDGLSTDGSTDLVKSYSGRISYFISEPDNGIYNAMNKGIKKASGEYCLFLNSGDHLISDDILEKLADSLTGKEIIYGQGVVTDESGNTKELKVPAVLSLDFFWLNSLVHPSSFIKRELFNIYGFYNETNRIVSDWEFFIKTIIVNNVSYKSIPLTVSVVESNGLSRVPGSNSLIEKECLIVLNRYFPAAVVNLLTDYKKVSSELNWIKKKPFISLAFRMRKIKHSAQGKRLKDLFTGVYEQNYWGGADSVSGPGSDDTQTAAIQKELGRVMLEYGVKTIVDAPCGDFKWMKRVVDSCYDIIESYTGIDIVDKLIEENNSVYSDSKISFKTLDLTKADIPASDLIICRDCFIHLSFRNIFRILKRFKKSGSAYLLVSTYNDMARKNNDIADFRINFRALNMQKFPFLFPEPVQIINEHCTEFEGRYSDKSLAMWKTEGINLFRIYLSILLWDITNPLFRIKQLVKRNIHYLKK